jgi:hypothetical protein
MTKVFFSLLWCSSNGDHPQNDLIKFLMWLVNYDVKLVTFIMLCYPKMSFNFILFLKTIVLK